jgi:uncharacterized protein (TIGR01777 family)
LFGSITPTPSLVSRRLRIVLPGGSGQIGEVLARFFQSRGHDVTVLTRGPFAAPWQTVYWDGVTPGPWTEHLDGADVCINLAGRSVNCCYRAANRRAIYNSRIDSTRLLNRVVAGLANPPWGWLNASTATIYRHSLDLPMDEETGQFGGRKPLATVDGPDPWNFSARVASDWEESFFETPTPRTRKIALRAAMVLSPVDRNAFVILSNLARMGLGGPQGGGRQFVSWIHELDFARAIEFLLVRDDLAGPFNLTAPNPLPNREFMKILRQAWEVNNGLPIPRPALEVGAFLLRTETELVLKSRRVIPLRLMDAGFAFEFPHFTEAAEELVRRWRHRFD